MFIEKKRENKQLIPIGVTQNKCKNTVPLKSI